MRTNEHKIVVFTGNYGYSVRKGIAAIDRAIPGLSWLVVIDSRRKTPSELLLSQLANLKKTAGAGYRIKPRISGSA